MFASDMGKHRVYIFQVLDRHERFSVLFHSRESVEVLNEVFATLENPFPPLGFDQEPSVLVHNLQYLFEGWRISS